VKTCPDCNGDGVIEKGTDDEQQCPTCGGSGLVPDDNSDNDDEVIRTAVVGSNRPKMGFSVLFAVISDTFLAHLLFVAILSQGPKFQTHMPNFTQI
jgi:hypothetical protein